MLFRPIFRLFIYPNFLFIALVFTMNDQALINVMNAALFAIALGVCTAYFPIARDLVLFKKHMDSADWLGLGVFCNWTGVVMMRVWSFSWRWVGKPEDWNDSKVLSYTLFLSCCGGIFHLVATQAIGNRMPTRNWVLFGAWVSGIVFTILIANLLITDHMAP